MKRISILLTAAALILLLAGCTAPPAGRQAEDQTADGEIIRLEAGMWPENEYTEKLPKPETGTVQTGWIDPVGQYCYIELTNLEEADSEEYLSALAEAGYQEIEKVSEQIAGQDTVSTGVLLSDGERYLSIQSLSENLVLRISCAE